MFSRDKRNKDADRFVHDAMCVFKSIGRPAVSYVSTWQQRLNSVLFFAFKSDHETFSLIHLLMWPMPSSLLLNLTCSLNIKIAILHVSTRQE